ncbi:MAG: EAL domain-containing protein [Pseudomonadota bacterium]
MLRYRPVALESWLALAFTALYAAIAYGVELPEYAKHWFHDIAWTLAAGAAGARCLTAARRLHDFQRTSWRLFALGCFAWTGGMLIWGYQELWLRSYIPFPAWSDAGFLLLAPSFLLGYLVWYLTAKKTSLNWLQLSKAGILLSSLAIIHIMAFQPYFQQQPDLWLGITALAYPILYNGAFLYGLVLLWMIDSRATRYSLGLLTAGLGAHTLANSLYAYQLLGEQYAVGGYLDVMWVLGFALIYLAAAQQTRMSADASATPRVFLTEIPYDAIITGLSMLAIVVFGILWRERFSLATLYLLAPTAFLLIIFLTLRELASHRHESHIKRELHRSREALAEVLDTVPCGVEEIDTDGIIRYSNRAHHEILGYDYGELPGKHIADFAPSEEKREELRRDLAHLVQAQPEPTPYVLLNLRKDGRLILMQVDWNYKRDERGNLIGFTSILTDITAKRFAEDQLKQAAAVFENTVEGVMITDDQARIVAVNQAFTEITGYQEEEVLGKNPRLLRSDHHDAAFFDAMWDTLRREGAWRGEIWNRRKNGEVFPVWQAISAIKDDKDQVINYVSVFSDISSLKQAQQRLNYLAQHDPLTGLPNRLLFEDRLSQAIQRAAREQLLAAVMFIDLDRFKNINDSLGHAVGDALLKETAQRLRETIRKEDTVARLGGDEFVIIAEAFHEAADAAQLARKLIEAFAQPFLIKEHELHMTLSIGISLYPRDGDDIASLLKHADIALYRVKQSGRNNFQFYTEEMTYAVLDRIRMESELRRAFDQGELCVYYQPQIDMAEQRLVSVEALLRWRRPNGELIPPERFIPLAEDTGQIIAIGAWVLEQACRQFMAWRAEGFMLMGIAVNVSGLQFQRPDFCETVRRTVEQTGIPPGCLELEITENCIMQPEQQAQATLAELERLGVKVSIDDFGTGYSSLTYLKRLAVDKLKIDRSFVTDIPHDPDSIAIVRAVIALGQVMKLDVIAEGVETWDQHAMLLSQGCQLAQGYYFSQPLPPDELRPLLEEFPAQPRPENQS